ncbi:MAG TPA: extradiol ring-cleavage dioxygenase [Bacillus sp. (in: firmicutes)]|uniref:DODA-type extradiol aromatic ring-opening family dioxygenase n=1 Tax=Bacillus litorisediminis TaxID=2922713 RepID=UPI001FAD01D0|nr:extradiol ring-cleavage dioxygenase [Bacillus litorisediminis]HWO76731.1 extradiol ring-cleavage dioxygenase [Bacillus sp. (in: firmicutes)]
MKTNPFVYACMTPHGGEIIPELSRQEPERMKTTRQSLYVIGKEMEAANPDTIIVLTPHGVRVNGQFSITNSERMVGSVEENDAQYELERKVDRELANSIAQTAMKNNIPLALINYGTSAGPISCLPMDWGVIVPLAFMPNVPIVVVTPPRELSFDFHYHFGEALREAVQAAAKRVALVASCDWSHTHDEEGPYGFDHAAKELDKLVVQYTQNNELEKIAHFDKEFIEAAKPDGIWQTMILAGAIPKGIRQIDFLSYEAPTYFGMMCASVTSKEPL